MYNLSKSWPLSLGRSGWLLAGPAFLALLFAVYLVDVPLSAWGQSAPPPVTAFFRFITDFGTSGWILIPSLVLLLLCALLARFAKRLIPRLALLQMTGIWGFIFVGVALPGLLINLAKRLIGRGRPLLLEQPDLPAFQSIVNDWTYQSFPSGHATTAFAFCFVISFLAPRSFPWMLLLAIAVGVSRVVVGAHFPTDVLGGAVFGTLGAYGVRNFFASRGWVFRRRPDGTVGMRRLAAVRRLVGARR